MEKRAYWIVHAVLIASVVFSRFDAAVISIALIVAIFSNLGSSESEYSAYSIFNKGCKYLLGDARADQIDKQLRGGTTRKLNEQEPEERSVNMLDIPSKLVNRPCPCGSGLKAKKCHANRRTGVSNASKPAGPQEEYDYSGFEVVER